MSEPIKYQPEDCIVEYIGELTLADGRNFYGALVTFPVSPPELPMSVVWDRVPMLISPRK